jgi:hypothetical protein
MCLLSRPQIERIPVLFNLFQYVVRRGFQAYNLRIMFTCELSNENMNAKGCVPKE